MIYLILIVVISYLVGSIPFSIIISKAVKGIDIRQHGSGNAGGTNVYRVLGWKWGILSIALDALKGVFAVAVVSLLFHYSDITFQPHSPFEDITIARIIAGLAAIIGHIWSVFASFRGGKGIATALGMLLAITTIDILIAMGVFFIVVLISRYVSLGSLLGAFSVPAVLFIRENIFHADVAGYDILFPFLIILFALILFTHRKNIARLLKGSENRITICSKDKQNSENQKA